MATVTFNTLDFHFSHGKAPKGYGSWGFFFKASDRKDCTKAWFAPSSSFADAKKAAKEEAARRNVRVVYVAP